MDELHKEFNTKLSLTKFIALIHRLTSTQRHLVCTIGLGHLLELKCDVLPRGLISFLVTKFDTHSRTLFLRDGPGVIVTSFFIHQILGTPIGGRHIGERIDPELRLKIADMTNCKGRYPTISELDRMITPVLEGDIFKTVFGMFPMTVFLCPSSHDAVSPDYLHVFREPDNISSFDFSAAVLDKLVTSIEAYNDRFSSVLGGNLLSLLIIFLEFKESNIVPFELKKKWPRISVWTNQMVNDVEAMDCISWHPTIFGKLPTKDVSETPFTSMSVLTSSTANKSYEGLLQFLLSICPENQHSEVTKQLPIIMNNLYQEIVDSMQPILFENIMNVLKLLPSTHPASQANEGRSFQIVHPRFNSPVSAPIVENHHVPIKLPDLCATNPMGHFATDQSSGPCTVTDTALTSENMDVVKDDGCVLQIGTAERNFTVSSGSVQNQQFPIEHFNLSDTSVRAQCSVGQPIGSDIVTQNLLISGNNTHEDSEFKNIGMFMLPVPDDAVLQKLEEEAFMDCKFPSMRSLIEGIQSIPQEYSFDLPYPLNIEETFHKREITNVQGLVPEVIDLVSYIAQEIHADERMRRLMTNNLCRADEKVEIFNDLFTPSLSQNASKGIKRADWMSTNDDAVHVVALKKRARMLVMSQHDISEHQNAGTDNAFVGVHFHEAGPSGGHTTIHETPHTNANTQSTDIGWWDEDVERELWAFTDRAEQEYLARKLAANSATQARYNFHISEISPRKIISTFSSTLVEQEVFNDIIARIPKTAKSKTSQIVVMGSTWAEHRVFGLSMQVYGKVHPYVINMLGKAMMVEAIERKNLGITREGQWKRYFFECKIAALFKLEHENPGKLSNQLSNGMLGFMLDTMDLIHLPLFTSGFHYLLVVNLKQKVFEVLFPNKKMHLIKDEADVAIKNFKMSFSIAYRHSLISMDGMETVYRSVCCTERDGDSGVFVMKLICDYDGDKTITFEPEHAKPIRESLTYYMVAHPFNEKMPIETKRILDKHNIPYDFSTPGYTPWMHEQNEPPTI